MSMENLRWILLPVLALSADVLAHGEEVKLTTITAGDIEIEVPETWKPAKTTSRLRLAQFEIPNTDADGENAELAVFYFGGSTGGIRANVERWIGQFYDQQRTVEIVNGKCREGRYVLADIAGTWKKPDGPPFAQKTIDKPGSRVIGVILMTTKGGKEDYYFLKLSGPDGLVKSQAVPLRRAIGVDDESEQSFELDDAEN